jgi:hypothetical protein
MTFTASDAKQLAKQELDVDWWIFTAIKKAAAQGFSYVDIETYLSETQENKLEELGYVVIRSTNNITNAQSSRINWWQNITKNLKNG